MSVAKDALLGITLFTKRVFLYRIFVLYQSYVLVVAIQKQVAFKIRTRSPRGGYDPVSLISSMGTGLGQGSEAVFLPVSNGEYKIEACSQTPLGGDSASSGHVVLRHHRDVDDQGESRA